MKERNMSLKYALDLLQSAQDIIKIKEGPFSKGRHCLTTDQNRLVLTINTGEEFRNFLLDEQDLLKDPKDLIGEISRVMEGMSPMIDLKDMN